MRLAALKMHARNPPDWAKISASVLLGGAYVAPLVTEGWQSGLSYLTRNQACRKVPWVRIPPPPPCFAERIESEACPPKPWRRRASDLQVKPEWLRMARPDYGEITASGW